jgi:hypothetical protein
MAVIERRLAAMGLELPEALKVREGLQMPFAWVRIRFNRAYISGHVACNPDGTLAKPLGKVGAEVSPTAWLRVFAMVNVAPGFIETPLVTNGYSELILELYGPEAGAHARSSIGMVIPLDAPVNCEAEVEIDG